MSTTESKSVEHLKNKVSQQSRIIDNLNNLHKKKEQRRRKIVAQRNKVLKKLLEDEHGVFEITPDDYVWSCNKCRSHGRKFADTPKEAQYLFEQHIEGCEG